MKSQCRVRGCAALLGPVLFIIGCASPTGDGELSLTMLSTPSVANSGEPHLAVSPSGNVALSWLQQASSADQLRVSTLEGSAWTAPNTVATGSDWFVNWADFPSVVPIYDDLWAAHWLVKKPGGIYAYDIALAVSVDRGVTWTPPFTPHRDGTPTEHGFVSLFAHDGGVGVAWLDGRNGGANVSGHDHANSSAQMTLRFAAFDRTLALTGEALLDDRVCDCCQTDAVNAASGAVVAYRDRSAQEIRDIAVTRFAGRIWQSPEPVSNDGWQISGCPVNGPALDARADSVVMAWYTGADDRPLVRFARSDDAGETFGQAIDIDADGALGRADVALMEDGSAVVSWVRASADHNGQLMVRRVDVDGALSRAFAITAISPSRASGFPQMVRRNADLIFAWTDARAESPIIRSAVLADAARQLSR